MSTTYRDFMNSIIAESRKNNVPYIGNIELTGCCNLACEMCYVIHEIGGRDLSTAEWNTLLEDAAKAGMGEAYLSGGEPLLREDFEEIYCKLYDQGVRIMVITNGLLFDTRIIKFMKRRPPEGISITLYGCNNDTYHKITHCKNGYDKVSNSIQLIKDNHLPLSLKVPALKPLRGYYHEIKKMADKNDATITLGKYISPIRGCNTCTSDWRMAAKEIKELALLIEGDQSYIYAPQKRTGKIADCNWGNGRFAICYDGRMTGCLSYTEIFTDPLKEGFKPALERLRKLKAVQSTSCNTCDSCHFAQNCSMCPGINYAETGSLKLCSEYRKSLAQHHVL